MRFNPKYVVATAVAAGVLAPAAAIGAGEGLPIDGGQRNPSSDAYSRETEVIADNGTFGTRQSNKRVGDGGGAIYGCRSSLANEACIRANNLNEGRAFEFVARGKEAGRITLEDKTGAPVTTNATGVATGFNADKVDGKDATEFATAGSLKFAVVNATGALGNNRGATGANLTDATAETFTVTFDADVSKCSFTATAVGAARASALGVQGGSDPKTVVVDQADPGDTDAFHLQVIC